MSERPDFEALRKARNENIRRAVREMCAEHGWDESTMHMHSFNPDACYCNCPEGPCEHDFQGWREFEDGSGGEQVCSRCSLGAMSHSMRVGP